MKKRYLFPISILLILLGLIFQHSTQPAAQTSMIENPESLLPDLSEDQYYLHDLPGFLVVDKNKGRLGDISSVVEANQNILLVMIFEGKEVLIPLQDDIVQKVDKVSKEIHTVLPDGLLEIYLES